MSSGTRYNPGSVRKLLDGMASRLTAVGNRSESTAEAMRRISRLGMSPRQLMLNKLWSWYRTEQYASRNFDWNGQRVLDPIEHEAISHGGVIPPGFYDATGQNLPIKFRKPNAPYALPRVIVDRFTGLLFSERHHPKIEVEGDPILEDLLGALVEQGRLWPTMIQARNYGGAMGTVAMGFQFVNGELEFEVHDPRWCTVRFKDRTKLNVEAFEKRYMYPVDEIDEIKEQYVTNWYWYRRVIDAERDVLYEPAPVGDGNEPQWVVKSEIVHGLGFCPIVWVQNLPVQDDIDGDPDCLGVYEMVEAMDALLSQSHKGTVANCDPTLVLSTDAELDSTMQKGTGNAIKLPSGGNAQYLEITGSGPRMSVELFREFRKLALEVAQCVLEHPDVANRTATEIDRVYSSMISKADVIREQYGEKGIKPLLNMVISAIRIEEAGYKDPTNGEIVRGKLNLPPRQEQLPNGDVSYVERKLGDAVGVIQVKWPKYFEPMLTDVELATRSAIAAKAGGLLDLEHAVKYIAEHYRVEDVAAMIARIKAEQQEQQDRAAQQALGMLGASGVGDAGVEDPTDVPPPETPQPVEDALGGAP